ncbi:MAG: methylcobalamin:coenzyme M methyltransferase [candidate division BRC1 bacterium ADurb.BinA292]|nr:MAG: methylcobalamin:coenzyme M methyltransferase [candidate division BRC1 bacterium ADurb.BinA292]
MPSAAVALSHRERVRAVYLGQPVDRIPLLYECPMDVTATKLLAPPPTGDEVADEFAFAECFDNSAIGVGIKLAYETLSQDEGHRVYRYETGLVVREQYRPVFNRHVLKVPIESPGDALKFQFPEVHAPGRYDAEELRRRIAGYHAAGYFVEGWCIGGWGSVYGYLARFDDALRWMLTEPEAAHALFDMLTRFSVESARVLLDCGVDALFVGSDLGSGRGLIFAPPLFDEYVSPWLKAVADLAHERGAWVHLHSHGHIQDLMDGIVAAGVDMINPVGPSDYNDLALFKARWGDRIVLHGGISTRMQFMSEEEIRSHVREVVAVGRRGGRFIPRTESGIPPMRREQVRAYLDTLSEERAKGYA